MSLQVTDTAALQTKTGAIPPPFSSGLSLAAHPAFSPDRRAAWSVALFRLAKPGIVLAEVLAGLAGVLLASPALPVAAAICPILIAIALTAGGAAVLNNILDAETDRHMSRLDQRCRALETVGHCQALAFALILMGGGLILGALTAPPMALLLLAIGCLSYLLLYTAWGKRCSPWGVLAGGIPGALPPLIGAMAVSTPITAPPLLLALFIFIWQLPHFWLLALDCRDQYARAGIPVLPLTHGVPLTRNLTMATTAILPPLTIAIGITGSLSTFYHIAASVSGAILLLYSARSLYLTHAYRKGFRASLVYLLTIFGAICFESLFP